MSMFKVGDKVVYLGPYKTLFPARVAVIASFKGRALYLRFNHQNKLIPISKTNADWIKLENPNDILKELCSK